MRYILITGGLGFIGSNFINYLTIKYPYITVVIYDIQDYCSSKDNITWKDNIYFVDGDLCDYDKMLTTLQTYNIDTVIHFAAQTHNENSFNEPLNFFKTNVYGSCILYECLRLYNNIECIIHISTDEVYGDLDINEISYETSMLKPTTPYSYSKMCGDHIAECYYKVFKLPIIIVRINNGYGINQYPEKLIPKFIFQLLHNEKITIQGTGENRRNFIHVYDIFTGIETILLHGMYGEIYNIGVTNEYSVLEIATILCKLANKKFNDVVSYVPDRKINDYRYNLDSSKIMKLGWKPVKNNFKEELRIIFDYYKQKLS